MANLPTSTGVDASMTSRWMKLSDLRSATPVEVVILNNLEYVMHQNQAILKGQEQILIIADKLLKKKATRGSSIGSTAASSRDETEGIDPDDFEQTTEAEKAMMVLKDKWMDDLCEHFYTFVTSQGKKVYSKRVVQASTDANEFAESVIRHFQEIHAEHQIPELMAPLNADIRLGLYVTLGKMYKAREKEGASQKAKLAASQAGKKGKGKRVAEGSSSSSQTSERESRAKKRRTHFSGEGDVEEDEEDVPTEED